MAKPNYSFEKRQRELAKKKKKEEKAQRKSTPGQGHESEHGSAYVAGENLNEPGGAADDKASPPAGGSSGA